MSLPAAAGHATGTGQAGQAGAGQAAGPDVWSEGEIKEALARCTAMLKGVTAVFELEDPIKNGACGSPAVYRLSSVGKGPVVEFNPPVSITCDMIVSLEKWMRVDVQPKARSALGGPIVKIDTMSSYSCRNAYGRARTRLSEHGRANAIDIGSFATARDSVSVLADWGLTVREQRALAAKQEAERAAAAAASRAQPGGLPQVPGTMAPLPGSGQMIPIPGGSVGFGSPNRLGGPKTQPVAPAKLPTLPEAPLTAPSGGSAKRTFIRDIHASACKHFGTVLGPEANNAHKNHFHLDMAPRRLSNFCE